MNPWTTLVRLIENGMQGTAGMLGGSLGAGIFALTLAARTVMIPIMLPLAIRSRKWRATHTRIKPEIGRLTKEHKADVPTMQRELKALHEREGIGQVDGGGLLMSLVQVPVLIAFFQAVLHLSEGNALATGGLLAGFAAALLSWGSTVLGDPSTPRVMIWISVILPIIIGAWLGLGIGLYLIAFYLGTLVQSLLMRRRSA